ncbi:hypothetical protein B0G77_0904 [Paraburkholderia sp. BL10I2N1]|nr:hypothetical protein B0G77_0904 [Paraburkholderia sp. BL10I2N1]
MKCRPRRNGDIGPTPDRPSHSTARDKGLIHPTPHCVRRGPGCFVVEFNAAAACEALPRGIRLLQTAIIIVNAGSQLPVSVHLLIV